MKDFFSSNEIVIFPNEKNVGLMSYIKIYKTTYSADVFINIGI